MFLGYIHYFRALAIFFIISGHSIDAFSWDGSEDIEKILRIFFSNGSVLFVFIAGYLFQHLSGKYETIKYYKSKLNNVLCPYFLISIPAIYIFTTILEREAVWKGFYEEPIWMQIILFYITGHHLTPLWFIPMIFIFYIIAPILIIGDKKQFMYRLLPLFIILSCYIGRGLPFQSSIHFFSVYLLGMFCSRYKNIINKQISQKLFLFVSFTLVIALGVVEFIYMQETMTYINYLQKMSMSLFFLGLLFKFNTHLKSKYISLIANTSFGVFFIHSYILSAEKLGYIYFFGVQARGNLIDWFFIAMITLNICAGLIFLISKTLGKYSRYIVGS